MKSLFETMKKTMVNALEEIALEVVEFGTVEKKLEDGSVQKNVRFLVEVPKGNGELSKVRITVKTPVLKLPFTLEEVETERILVRFVGLEMSYIDSKQNCYFKAENVEVEEI